MQGRHSLLNRQLKRHFPETEIPEQFQGFIDAVESAYHNFDLDRGMLERSLDLSSHELMEKNAELRQIQGELERRVEGRTQELSAANKELLSEIAERERFEAQLVHIASHDSLTDLFNRRYFEQELGQQVELAKSKATEGAVLFVDLDQFKDVNDTMGHVCGDELLRCVVDLLQTCLREEDVLARQGGDEFAILLPRTSPSRSRAMASQIEEAIRRHVFWVERRPLSITASVGVALFPKHGTTTAELLSNADLAMYQAKSNGRSRVEVFSPKGDWRSHSETRLRWRNQIVEAIEHNRLMLYAQPIHDLRRGSTDDYEILLRLLTEDGQVVRPGSFMDVVEDFGLAPAVDRWVVKNSLKLIAEQHAAGNKIKLAVNLSGKSLGDGELLSLIRSQISAHSFDPAYFVPEVTETAAIANLGQAQKFIKVLKDLGCRFALDDFGVGFSSFYHLKHLPVDFLKIDGAFIKDLPRSAVDRHLVKAMVAVAQGLGKQTIAEFVGDRETVELLRSYGVDYAQGYYIGRPREVAQILGDPSALKVA